MGKGKGSPDYWVCSIRAGQILFELSNVRGLLAMLLLKKASKKLPITTKVLEIIK
jgi:large subunit ribosomal protein L16